MACVWDDLGASEKGSGVRVTRLGRSETLFLGWLRPADVGATNWSFVRVLCICNSPANRSTKCRLTLKRRLTMAYIEAVASCAGFQVEETKVDLDSVDGTLKGDFGRRPRIEFQAKATARDVVRGSHVHFPLSIKNYDDLRDEAINPRILIVLVMPKEIDEWVSQTQEELCLRHCAYWMSLRGEPATSNAHNVTVQVPLTLRSRCL